MGCGFVGQLYGLRLVRMAIQSRSREWYTVGDEHMLDIPLPSGREGEPFPRFRACGVAFHAPLNLETWESKNPHLFLCFLLLPLLGAFAHRLRPTVATFCSCRRALYRASA